MSAAEGRAAAAAGSASPPPLIAPAAAPTALWAMAEPVPNAMPCTMVPMSPDIIPPPAAGACAGGAAAGARAGGGGARAGARAGAGAGRLAGADPPPRELDYTTEIQKKL